MGRMDPPSANSSLRGTMQLSVHTTASSKRLSQASELLMELQSDPHPPVDPDHYLRVRTSKPPMRDLSAFGEEGEREYKHL